MNEIFPLRSRSGDSYITLIIVILPLLMIVLATGIDGLALAVSYNRAVGLAKTAAQAGATSVEFTGSSMRLSPGACAVAVANACANAGTCSAAMTATCTQSVDVIEVLVSLKPLRVFGGAIGPNAERVVARARSAPLYGINEQEN